VGVGKQSTLILLVAGLNPSFKRPKKFFPHSLLPTPYSLLPTPSSLLPTPYSLLPTPYSLLQGQTARGIA